MADTGKKPPAQSDPAQLLNPTEAAQRVDSPVTAAEKVTGVTEPLKVVPNHSAATPQSSGKRVGGDTCDVATVIPGLPYSDTGNTCGYIDDYDEVCPYSGSTSPDVAYEFTPAADVAVDISLCNDGTWYDTKLYVYQDSCPGILIACNDDACTAPNGTPYVSELLGVALSAGNTYYIIVDGYGGDCGDYEMTVAEGAGPPECPPDSLFSQRPHLPSDSWSIATSAETTSFHYRVYENFWDVTQPICDIHWWGLALHYDGGWYACADPYGLTFEIIFYQDAGGMPGAPVCTYTGVVPDAVTETDYDYAGFPMYYWEVNLLPCCVLEAGWVSIKSELDNVNDCAFLWHSGPDGDGDSLQETVPGTPAPTGYDRAFCLTPSAEPGACCDDSTGICEDGIEAQDCPPPLRFAPGTLCIDLEPPCGETEGACCVGPDCMVVSPAECDSMGGNYLGDWTNCGPPNPCVGACCHPDGTCDLVTSEDECTGPDDLWLGLGTTCDMCPCIVPCPPEGVAEGEPCGEDTNGGCNMASPAFEPLACGETICGTGWADSSLRDTDWFEVVVDEPTIFTWAVEAEFGTLGVLFGMIEQYTPGVPGCANTTGYLDPYAIAGECQPMSVTTECMPAGTYYFFVAPSSWGDLPCDSNNDYVATLTCESCYIPTGACCLWDGTCIDDLTVDQCTGMNGTYMGDDTLCAEVECPVNEPDYVVDAPGDWSGTTCGAGNDCDLRPSEEIIYEVNIPNDGTWVFSLCGSDFDTYLYVGTHGCTADIGYNDDYCGLQSQLEADITAGTYYVDIEAYSEYTCGNYVLTIWERVPCDLECPPEGVPEDEPCGEDTNGGCNMATPTFEPIECGMTKCGTAWFDGSTRDTDWYVIEVADDTVFHFTVEAEFAVLFGKIGQYVPGVPGCDNTTGSVDPYAVMDECMEATVTTDCMPPGTYYFFVAPQFLDTVECPAEYIATLTCEDCVPPEPPANDDCENAEPIGDVVDLAFSTDLATFDGLGTCMTSPNIWYCYTATCTGEATISLCGSEYDTKLAVYDGCTCDPLGTELCCNDDYCGLQSQCTVPVIAGQEYLIEVGGYSTATGDGVLNVWCEEVLMGACCVGLDCVATTTEDDCVVNWGGFWYEGEDCFGEPPFECPPEYCTPCYSDYDDDFITNVTFNTIDNDTGPEGPPCSYGYYVDQSTEVEQGETYTLSVSVDGNGSWTEHVRAWFDWNQDYTLDTATESYYVGSVVIVPGTPQTVTTDITIPEDSTLGATRMRVIERYYEDPNDPCEDYYYGEAEDYTVVVAAGICGDLDLDGDVDVDDYFLFLDAFGSCAGDPKYIPEADLDSDGCITLVDYQLWLLCYWDANGKPARLPVPAGQRSMTPGGNQGGVGR
jgi:hypothetical protein